MLPLLVVAAAVLTAVFWLRGARRNRLAWLRKLNLPGHWRSETGALRFQGGGDAGTYVLSEGATKEQGRWRLQGHDLILAPDAEEPAKRYDLRLFKPGEIGIDGPGLARRIYRRQADNVVQLKSRK